ncbi:protein SAR DEFICIENT 1 [Coffea arabica]|uniref:Protein SAR DEFICIENT 1 n=1 Tax=Coffea arabica TaxID=13443 RepID=A0A6P6X4E6_COFAR|nr:protein SAR DEFICIENT 1-like [Coffea arabica]
MAAKRLFDDSDNDHSDQSNPKRIKTTKPTFASVIKEVVTLNFLENFCSSLEPMLRRVVNEEVENGLRRNLRSLTKAPSLRIQAIDELPTLQLIFNKKLLLPIFTGSKITDTDSNHLQVVLVDTRGDGKVPAFLPYSLKIEIVVLDGDFPAGDSENWTNEEFDKHIVKERTGKRPLLAGELNAIMRDGLCSFGDIEFTDNSSWIRSRRFRLGAKVVQGTSAAGQVARVRPAMSESFVVKDHRGELYKKHYPPSLHDDVWRLEKIGKDGAFHKKLSAEGVNTVQDFLKLNVIDPQKLKKILGLGMSEKMWEVTLKHAWTCNLGTKLYISRGSNYIVILNPVCQVVKAVINGQHYVLRDLKMMNKGYVEKLGQDAYANWKSLEEIEGQVNETALLTMGEIGDQVPNHQQPKMGSSYQGGQALLLDGSTNQMASIANNNEQVTYNNDWGLNCSYLWTPGQNSGRYFPESSSEGDLH